jgi:Flp pilus assembly CpaE family ATPase/DNA-binding response OmpR family regulator
VSPTLVVIEPDGTHRTALVDALADPVTLVDDVDRFMHWHSARRLNDERYDSSGEATVVLVGPAFDAVETCRRLHDSGVLVTVIGVTHRCTVAELRRALRAGVADLVPVTASAGQLRHAVRRAAFAVSDGWPEPTTIGVDAPIMAAHAVMSSSVTSPSVTLPPVTLSPDTLSPDTLPPDTLSPDTLPPVASPAGRSRSAALSPLAEEAVVGPLAVLSPKGGSGGSTIAVNLAAALAIAVADRGPDQPFARVALMDADLQFGDLPLLLGVDPGPSLASGRSTGVGAHLATVEGVDVERLLVAVPYRDLAVLAAPVDPVLAETVAPGVMTAALRTLDERFAAVVVDLPSRLDDLVVDLVAASKTLIVVTATDLPGVKDTAVALDVLRRLGVADESWLLVCNRVGEAGGLSLSQIESYLGLRIHQVVPDDPAVRRAARRGRPVVVDAPGVPAARALRCLAETVTTADADPRGAPSAGWPLLPEPFGRWLAPVSRRLVPPSRRPEPVWRRPVPVAGG